MKTRAINRANLAICDMVKFAKRNPWAYAAIADSMTRACKSKGETFYRQEVNAWLLPDAKKRTEPRLGAGLLLLEQGAKIMAIHSLQPVKKPA